MQDIKTLGGSRWNGTEGCWVTSAHYIDHVREFMEVHFGESDVASAKTTLTLRLKFIDDMFAERESVVLFGKVLARATGRDSGAFPGDGVAYAEGKPTSGGSRNNWRSIVPEGAELVLYDVPELLYKRDLEKCERKCTVEIVDTNETASEMETLLAERERLQAQLDEINRQIDALKEKGD